MDLCIDPDIKPALTGMVIDPDIDPVLTGMVIDPEVDPDIDPVLTGMVIDPEIDPVLTGMVIDPEVDPDIDPVLTGIVIDPEVDPDIDPVSTGMVSVSLMVGLSKIDIFGGLGATIGINGAMQACWRLSQVVDGAHDLTKARPSRPHDKYFSLVIECGWCSETSLHGFIKVISHDLSTILLAHKQL